MKYLKGFSTESDYLAYRDGVDYLKPNVSLSDDKGSVYYNFTPPPIVYEAVDLGLPSGTKWATQNVGARKPSDAGLYFQWGDTVGYTDDQVGTGEGQKKFATDWSDYKWGVSPYFTKYTTEGATLELEDDAAHVHMGGNWHMPTDNQINELINNTTTAWTTSDGISGVTFASKNDTQKYIFIPAAGYVQDGSVLDSGSNGFVWSSVTKTGNVPLGGNGFYFHPEDPYFGAPSEVIFNNFDRYRGLSVRGVIG